MSGPATAKAARDLAGTWLAHLPRDTRGLPVPWVNRWGAETVATTRVAHDRYAGRPAVFHDDHGDVPDFTRQNIGRQRQAVFAGLCQVCGRPCPWPRRNLVVSGISCETIRVQDLGERVAIHEPWLDDRCAAIAALLCPALIRRRHDDDLHLVPVRSPREVQTVVSVGYLDPVELVDAGADPDAAARLAATAGGQVGMWAKLILLHHTITGRSAAPGRTRLGGG